MQSWGILARGPNKAHRHTQLRPTKCGVIGLVANALGLDWADDISDLAALRFGVRSDRPGHLEVDYHTAGADEFPLLPAEIYAHPRWSRNAKAYSPGRPFDAKYVAPADITRDPAGQVTAKPGLTVITQDCYLSDASFLAAVSGPDDLAGRVAAALAAPARTLYLGRRAYLPSLPIPAGLRVETLEVALTTAPRASRSLPGTLRAWVEPATPKQAERYGATTIADQPVSCRGPGRRGARLEHCIQIADSPDAASNRGDQR